MNSLLAEGFEYLTYWTLRGSRAKPATTTWDTTAGWLYMFVADDKVRYIGITTMVLRSRFDGYSYQANDSVGSRIKHFLEGRAAVQIYGRRHPGVSKADLEILESALIAKFAPDWNVRS